MLGSDTQHDLVAAHPDERQGLGVGTVPAGGLRLTRLTLVGFKSFADKTEFVFDDPVTGVVGPNGCGKSNLVDAIKWVLGERSSKSLRGKEMIDVIFAGSAGRKPSGFASVTLTFENPVCVSVAAAVTEPSDEGTERRSDEAQADAIERDGEEPSEVVLTDRARSRRPLPIDAEEVSVERQLFRDGTSKYLINGKRARLRDIRDLFMDTGIGADAYSIIEQGKVDAMLLASPQERRTIFEEAAGVAKYKQRRIEAQRKLERAETNLVRTREQLESTERRLRIVRGQAVKARRFRELDDECTALRLAVAFDQYDDVRLRLLGLTARLGELTTQRDEAQRELAALESAQREAEAARHEAAGGMRRAEEALQAAEHAKVTATQKGEMARRAIDEARRQLETERARVAQAEARAEALVADIARQRDAVAAVAERLAEAERELAGVNNARAAALERIAEKRGLAHTARSRAQQIERDRGNLLADLRGQEQRLAAVDDQRQRVSRKASELTAQRDRAGGDAADAEAKAKTVAATIADLERDLAARAASVGLLSQDRRDRAAALHERERDLASMDGRRGTLAEMVRARVGLGDAARAVMQAKDGGEGFEGVIAPLAELIEADAEHARAVEAALGHDLRAIVVRSLAEMPSAAALAALPGRVTLLPVQGPRDAAPWSASADPTVAVLAARVTPLRTLVRPARDDAGLAALLDRVLGDAVLVESLDAAALLAAGPMPRATFVTRDGTVLTATGRVSAGPLNAADESGEAIGGVIERAAELADLERRVGELRGLVERQRQELQRVDGDLAAVTAARAALERELIAKQREHATLRSAAERAAAESERLTRELATGERELTDLAARSATFTKERDALADRAASLERLLEEQRDTLAAAEGELHAAEQAAHAATERLTAAKVDLSRLGEQAQTARRELHRIEAAKTEAERHTADHRRHASNAEERCAQHERTVAEAAEALAAATRDADASRVAVAERRERVRDAVAAADAAGKAMAESRERARAVDRDWSNLEMARREADIKRESLEQRAAEDLRIDLDAEYLDYRGMLAGGGVARIDVAPAQARIAALRDEIKHLGNVNLDAIAEEETLAEKNDQLAAQVADIDAARLQLTSLIDTLNQASKERFGEVFEAIRANFGGPDGMFRRLFGGGKAEVRLMPLVKEVDGEKVVTDETDLLESGIEVIAKPPGKEPRSISQLSGGEKTLTAVALLMSIFRSKPSCFCVLDEVDAALDEANVGRYCNAVRGFTDMSRFIVITHNKKTMQMCDHLYGITQRERGVSSRVSVRFEQVGKDGEIRESSNAADQQSSKSEPAAPDHKPSGVLRRALAGMRSDEPARVASPD